MAELIDWFMHYLKQKDLHYNGIKGLEKLSDNTFSVEKSKLGKVTKEFGFSEQSLDSCDFDAIVELFNSKQKEDFIISHLVFYNTAYHQKVIFDNWKKLVVFRNLKVFFVNPGSIQKLWAFCPFSHDLVGGTAKGLKVLSADVSNFSSKDLTKLKSENYSI
ncbi:hypothetical protein JXM83_06280 [Candidatus Woesearchaeota archaeon]|nr:hypothetical protein [Candidatus Woesearchaeota archaeon]